MPALAIHLHQGVCVYIIYKYKYASVCILYIDILSIFIYNTHIYIYVYICIYIYTNMYKLQAFLQLQLRNDSLKGHGPSSNSHFHAKHMDAENNMFMHFQLHFHLQDLWYVHDMSNPWNTKSSRWRLKEWVNSGLLGWFFILKPHSNFLNRILGISAYLIHILTFSFFSSELLHWWPPFRMSVYCVEAQIVSQFTPSCRRNKPHIGNLVSMSSSFPAILIGKN